MAEHGKGWRNGRNNGRALRRKVKQWQSMVDRRNNGRPVRRKVEQWESMGKVGGIAAEQ